jgi:hypothetical protein
MGRKTWDDSFRELAQCLDETGELPPDHSLHPHVSSLAAWVMEQRRAYHSGRLAPGKKARLDLLNRDILKQPTRSVTGTAAATTTTTSSTTIPRRPSLLDGRFVPPPAAAPAPVPLQQTTTAFQPPTASTFRPPMALQHQNDSATTTTTTTTITTTTAAATNNTNHNHPQQPVREWNSTCIRLAHFVESSSRLPARVEQTKKDDDPENVLYGWIQTQRTAHHAGRLTHQQIQRLDHIDTRILSPVLTVPEPPVVRRQSLPTTDKERDDDDEEEEQYVTHFEVTYFLPSIPSPHLLTSQRKFWEEYGTVLNFEPVSSDEANTYMIQLIHSKSAAWILQELQSSQLRCHIVSLPEPYRLKES